MSKNKITSSDEAMHSDKQHTTPCGDCPFRRTAISGWLGGSTPEDYVRMAHQNTIIGCHAIRNLKTKTEHQCVGVAIYRKNVFKRMMPPAIEAEADRTNVFATPAEFIEHHSKLGKPKK